MNELTIQEELDAVSESIRKLRVLYEQYFAGQERLEPAKQRDEVKDTLRRLSGLTGKNTALRFRFNTLQASLVTHESYWNRICRQIEEGTFKRHKEKLQQAPDIKEAETAKTPAAAPIADKVPSYAESILKVYESYALATKRLGEKSPLSLDDVAKVINQQTPLIKERYRCKDVEFKVAMKDGKVILKAQPK